MFEGLVCGYETGNECKYDAMPKDEFPKYSKKHGLLWVQMYNMYKYITRDSFDSPPFSKRVWFKTKENPKTIEHLDYQ